MVNTTFVRVSNLSMYLFFMANFGSCNTLWSGLKNCCYTPYRVLCYLQHSSILDKNSACNALDIRQSFTALHKRHTEKKCLNGNSVY
mgnify:CR=1 FL=1